MSLHRETMRTPMRRISGLGAARSGTRHFWHARITSVAGLLLTPALIVIVIALIGRSHAATVQILGSPLVSILLLLFVLNTTYHMYLGIQDIVEDYVPHGVATIVWSVANIFFCVLVGFTCAYALLKLSFGV